MKSKKALKKLAKAEALLSGIIDQYNGDGNRVQDALTSAKESVARARETIDRQKRRDAASKPAGKAASASKPPAGAASRQMRRVAGAVGS